MTLYLLLLLAKEFLITRKPIDLAKSEGIDVEIRSVLT
jgi:hypothetical protein